MKKLRSVNKYFVKYKWHLLLGILFAILSSMFAVMPGNVVKTILDKIPQMIAGKEKESAIF